VPEFVKKEKIITHARDVVSGDLRDELIVIGKAISIRLPPPHQSLATPFPHPPEIASDAADADPGGARRGDGPSTGPDVRPDEQGRGDVRGITVPG
jgi:hypothetical protein